MPSANSLRSSSSSRKPRKERTRRSLRLDSLERREMMTATPVEFDFGTSTSELAAGAIRISHTTPAYSATQGYGFDALTGLTSLDTALSTQPMYRDYVKGTVQRDFRVDVANGEYEVTISSGAYTSGLQNKIQFALEGSQVALVDTQSPQFWTATTRVTVADGQLNLNINDADTSSETWYINGLSIRPVSAPTPLSGLKVDFGSETSPVAAGFVRSTRFGTYTSAQQYGWNGYLATSETDNGTSQTDMRRDRINGSRPGQFLVDVANGNTTSP